MLDYLIKNKSVAMKSISSLVRLKAIIITVPILSLSSCMSFTVVDFNRPEPFFATNVNFCLKSAVGTRNGIASIKQNSERILVEYQTPVASTKIYRGDCIGSEYVCNQVRYRITDMWGNQFEASSDPRMNSPYVKIPGARIKVLEMISPTFSGGIDRRSGAVLPCPL